MKFIVEYTNLYLDVDGYIYPDMNDIEIEADNEDHVRELFNKKFVSGPNDLYHIDVIHYIPLNGD